MSRGLRKSLRYPKAYQVDKLEPGQIVFSVLKSSKPDKRLSIDKFLKHAEQGDLGSRHFCRVFQLTRSTARVESVATLPFVENGTYLSALAQHNKYWTRYVVKPAFIKLLVKRGMIKILNEKLLF